MPCRPASSAFPSPTKRSGTHALSRTMQKTSYYYCRHSDADTLTTELSELLIDRVLVYSDKRIEIAYKIRDIFD